MFTVVGAGKGSPGCSTTSLALVLTWPSPVVLVEADPSGGDIRLGYAAGADVAGRGLLGFSLAARRGDHAEALWDNVIALGDQRWVLTGVDGSHQSADLAALVSTVGGLDVDVVFDVGRVPGVRPVIALLAAADEVVLVASATLSGVHAVQQAVPAVRLPGRRPSTVVVGAGHPYGESEVAAAMAETAPVVGSLPWDPRTAEFLSTGEPSGRHPERGPLLRAAARLATGLKRRCEPDASATLGDPAIEVVGSARVPAGAGARRGDPS